MTAAGGEGWIGRSLERQEDGRLLAGEGEFLADLRVDGCLHLCFVRSDHAHARIRSVRTAAALAMPGVVAAVTGAELATEMKGGRLQAAPPASGASGRQVWPLAVDEVCWHGEPVAAVVADDKYVAEDAAAAVTVDYEALPAVTDAETALREGAPRAHDGWESNEVVAASSTGGADADAIAANDAEVEAAFAAAAVVLSQRFRARLSGACPIETRGALALWSDADGPTLHLTTRHPHGARLALADLLGLPAAEVRIVAPRDQGGGFGVEAPVCREHAVVCHLARRLGRPVRWIETRAEHLMAAGQGWDRIHDLDIAADGEGRILALRDRGIADVGDGRAGAGRGVVAPRLGSVVLPGAYAIAHADITLRCAATNKASPGPPRPADAYAARFALERGLDMLARRLGLETAALKRRNLIADFPFTGVTGIRHDSGDYLKAWDALLERVDLAGFRAMQADARAEGHYLGIGFACGAELSAIPSDMLPPRGERADLPPGETPGLAHTARVAAPKPATCFTAHAATVEVDIETGRFIVLDYVTCEDAGTVIDPIVVEGEVQGGVVRGMSTAMFEELVCGEDGRHRAADFGRYPLASAADVPHVTVAFAPTPRPDHPRGVRAVGEGRSGPVPGALANAICDALAPFGVEITTLPLRPEMILSLIEAGRADDGGASRDVAVRRKA